MEGATLSSAHFTSIFFNRQTEDPGFACAGSTTMRMLWPVWLVSGRWSQCQCQWPVHVYSQCRCKRTTVLTQAIAAGVDLRSHRLRTSCSELASMCFRYNYFANTWNCRITNKNLLVSALDRYRLVWRKRYNCSTGSWRKRYNCSTGRAIISFSPNQPVPI